MRAAQCARASKCGELSTFLLMLRTKDFVLWQCKDDGYTSSVVIVSRNGIFFLVFKHGVYTATPASRPSLHTVDKSVTAYILLTSLYSSCFDALRLRRPAVVCYVRSRESWTLWENTESRFGGDCELSVTDCNFIFCFVSASTSLQWLGVYFQYCQPPLADNTVQCSSTDADVLDHGPSRFSAHSPRAPARTVPSNLSIVQQARWDSLRLCRLLVAA